MRRLFLLSILGIPVVAFAQAPCTIPQASAEYFAHAPKPGAGWVQFRQLGANYLQIRCLQDASAAYAQMAREASTIPEPLRTQVIQNAEMSQKLVGGMLAWDRGNFDAAQKTFVETSEVGMGSDITSPATYALADSMMQRFNPVYWPVLQSRLSLWQRQGWWKADYYLTLCGLDSTTADDRIGRLHGLLMKDLAIEERLADEVILLDALTRMGRLNEADLMARSIERDVGLKVWSPDLRFYYLQAAYGLSVREQSAGRPEAAARAAIYQNAMREFYVGK